MKDTVNSFKAHLYERTTSPLIGAFIFYWIVCNYQFIIILFDGDLKSIEKFSLIKTIYPSEVYTVWTGFDIHYQTLLSNGLLIPLVITLIYIFIIPYPTKLIYTFWKERQKELIKIKHNIDDDTPIGEEQARKLRNSLYELQKKHDLQFDEITNLKSLINNEESLPNIITDTEENSINEKEIISNTIDHYYPTKKPYTINEDESKILEVVGNTSGNYKISDLSNLVKDKIEFDYYIDILIENQLLKADDSLEYVILTKEGRASLIKFRQSIVTFDEDEIPF